MALYHKWDVKNDFAYVLQFFSLISNSLGGVFLLQENPIWKGKRPIAQQAALRIFSYLN